MPEPTVNELQNHRLAYPEAAWIAACGGVFPSHTQWLYKYLDKTDTTPKNTVNPITLENSYTTVSTKVLGNKTTLGSGKTTSGEKIQEKVSLDWVKWAISRKVWSLLYTKDKVDTTEAGKELILNEVRDVLKVAVDEGIFVSYRITEVVIDRINNNLTIKFTATLEHTILAVDISGSLYY
jgi:hypothetical protein